MKKQLAECIVEEYGVSITRACRVMDIHRSYFSYESTRDDSEVEAAIRKAAAHGEEFWKIFAILRREHEWNHKMVYRVYKALHLRKEADSRNDCQPG